MDLKAHSTHGDNQRLFECLHNFEVKIRLNMNSKPDKEWCKSDDIAFLSEIIENFRFWQEIWHFAKAQFSVRISEYYKFLSMIPPMNVWILGHESAGWCAFHKISSQNSTSNLFKPFLIWPSPPKPAITRLILKIYFGSQDVAAPIPRGEGWGNADCLK